MLMRSCLLLLLLGCFGNSGAAPGVGYLHLQLADPLDSQPLSAIAFYPAAGQGSSRIGPYRLEAQESLPPLRGRYPLLVLSHGNGGSPLAHHDMAIYLARHGFVVIAPWHLGDDDRDQSRHGTLSNLYGRPLQLSETIDAALHDSRLSRLLDHQRVGVIGYSAGGETALIMAGAQPSTQRLQDYCERFPADTDACSEPGGLLADRDDLAPLADDRVGAVLLLAPAGLMFGRAELARVQAPVMLYAGSADRLLPLEHNAAALARKLPGSTEYRLVDGAGHFVFLSPCSTDQSALMPDICQDAAGVDRQRVHRQLNAEAARFFHRALSAGGLSLVHGQEDGE